MMKSGVEKVGGLGGRLECDVAVLIRHGIFRRDGRCRVEIMRDEYAGHAFHIPQLDHQFNDGPLGYGIQARGGLIIEHDLWRPDQRSGNSYAALHPAGEFARHFVDRLFEANETQKLHDLGVDLLFAQFSFFGEAIPDIFSHAERIEQRAFLKNHAYAATDLHKLALAHFRDVPVLDQYLPRVRPDQAEDKLQDRGFARSAFTQDDLGFPGFDLEADVLKDGLIIEMICGPAEIRSWINQRGKSR